MWIQFFLENLHFAVNLFAALVFFATGWLYFDAWLGQKNMKDGIKVLGFFVLAISFSLNAASLETTLVQNSFFGNGISQILVAGTRFAGYLFLIFGLLVDPLQNRPHRSSYKMVFPLFLSSKTVVFAIISFPVLACVTGFLYLRKATIGLENHLKQVSLAFFLLSIYELISATAIFQKTSNVVLFKLLAPFGIVWNIEHIALFVAVSVLGKWTFGYLLKRLEPQLFMIYSVTILVIFLITTVSFTGLLLKNLENETLNQVGIDAKVLRFAINSKAQENLSDAQALVETGAVIDAVSNKSKQSLLDLVQNYLLTKKLSLLVVTTDTGLVLARGEDKERIGDSLSDDPLVKKALAGESNSSVVSKDGVLGPQVSVRVGVPVKKDGQIIGTVMLGSAIDSAFVDGIKSATGLEASVYGDNILSATTILSPDGRARYIGAKEEDENVKTTVIQKGDSLTSAVSILNTPYFGAYLPLKDSDNTPVGMLFVGKPQIGVLQAAGRSIELTFLVTVTLLILSIIPAFLISKYLSNQLN